VDQILIQPTKNKQNQPKKRKRKKKKKQKMSHVNTHSLAQGFIE
jgi:hypothetical protein